MFGKVVLIQFVVIVLMAGSGYAYFRYSQGVIGELQETKAKLEEAVKTQTAAIEAQKSATIKQNAEILGLQQNLADAETQRRILEEKLRRKDLQAMARANSADLERRINRATTQAFRDMENITQPADRPSKVEPAKPEIPALPSEKAVTPQPQPTKSVSPRPSNYQPPPSPPKINQGVAK